MLGMTNSGRCGATLRYRLCRAVPGAAAAVLAGALATACGGSASSGGAHRQAQAQALLAFSACIREHGVSNFPDPRSVGGFSRTALGAVNENSPQFQSADMSCRSLGIASGFDHGPGYIQKHVQQEIAESECMRRHGVPNMPLPDAQGQITFPPGLTPRSPGFQAAQRHCAYLNP
jgi:hypothetical protein